MTKKGILIVCERSGKVREALRKKGIDAWSCDLMPSDDNSKYHIQGDAIKVLNSRKWFAVIAFVPCTHLAVSGARWFKYKRFEQFQSIRFFMRVWHHDCKFMCIENPIGIMSTKFRKPDQIIQPWQFGHGEVKATCLWLRGFPKLEPTEIVEGREARVHRMSPGTERGYKRSITYDGIANAMADQWGVYLGC